MENDLNPQSPDKAMYKYIAVVFGIVAAFGIGVYIGGDSALRRVSEVGGVPTQIEFDLEYIQEIAAQIEQNYLGDLPTKQEVNQGLAKGLVEALGDEYSGYLSPTAAGEFLDSADSAYEGIGVYLGFDEQYTTVLSPIDGYPGQMAGLLAGDLILEVNEEDVAGLRPEEVATKIIGQAGTKVNLKIFREEDGETHEFEITRERIDLENIDYEELANDVYLIDIIRFTEGEDGSSTGVQVFNATWDKVAKEVAAKNPKGLIIDLRNNPGGFVHSVRYALEDFLPQDAVLMQEEEKSEGTRVYKDNRKGLFEDVPIVVLVNGGSASASEIFAGAIQDNDRGLVIGTKTYGKGVEQILVDLQDRSILMLTYKRWLTPSGRQISKEEPINPDVVEEYQTADEAQKEYDSQVLKALELLGN